MKDIDSDHPRSMFLSLSFLCLIYGQSLVPILNAGRWLVTGWPRQQIAQAGKETEKQKRQGKEWTRTVTDIL